MKLFILFVSIFSIGLADTYVTCDIYGQLGNQMFQTAAAISYALDHNAQARFPQLREAINADLNCKYVFHRLDLSPIPEEIDVYHDHNQITDGSVYAPIPDFGNKNIHLHAHFCSEKYFIKHANMIRELFEPTQEIIDEIRQKYGELLNQPTVAIHVRTFLPDHAPIPLHIPEPYRWHYYHNAMNQFSDDFLFLIFSDDMRWTKRNFPRTNRKIIFIEENSHIFDFYMMSLCDHQIVSHESTFSWWAAWLNKNPEKLVITPNTAGGIKNSDMLPESWKKLPLIPFAENNFIFGRAKAPHFNDRKWHS